MNLNEIYDILDRLTIVEKIIICKRLQDEIIDEELLKDTECRMKNAKEDDIIPFDEVLKSSGITKEHLNDIDVEIE